MTLSGVLAGLGLVVLVMLAARAFQAVMQEHKAPRGTLPGRGDTLIETNYISGGGGGGQTTVTRVPKDPQDYAKAFVPKERTPK